MIQDFYSTMQFLHHFEFGSEKYYHSLLNLAYEKNKLAIKNILDEQNAETVSICLDFTHILRK